MTAKSAVKAGPYTLVYWDKAGNKSGPQRISLCDWLKERSVEHPRFVVTDEFGYVKLFRGFESSRCAMRWLHGTPACEIHQPEGLHLVPA